MDSNTSPLTQPEALIIMRELRERVDRHEQLLKNIIATFSHRLNSPPPDGRPLKGARG